MRSSQQVFPGGASPGSKFWRGYDLDRLVLSYHVYDGYKPSGLNLDQMFEIPTQEITNAVDRRQGHVQGIRPVSFSGNIPLAM